MALTPIKLPQLQARIAIVDAKGQPTPAFVRYWNLDLLKPLEGTVNEIIQIQNDLAQVQATQAAEIARLNAVVFANQQTTAQAQAAQQAANNAQATADEALADGTVSGSALDPTVDVPDGTWVQGPQVDLTGVVAGTLTITGSGPQQDDSINIFGLGARAFNGEFRIVEIVGMTETTVFTGTFSCFQSADDPAATVANYSAAAVSSFSAPASSTGAVSYRMDARRVSPYMTSLTDLDLYIYVRRAP